MELPKPVKREKKPKKRPRRQKKTSFAKLKRIADALAGALCRSRGSCESGRPEHKGSLQWAHGFSRRYLSTRWDKRNGFCLCAGCHLYFTLRPHEWEAWMQERLGPVYYELQRQALSIAHIRPRDVEDTIEELERATKGEGKEERQA